MADGKAKTGPGRGRRRNPSQNSSPGISQHQPQSRLTGKCEVRALRRGFDGKQIREEGETFVHEGPIGSWMEEVKPARGPTAARSATRGRAKAGSKADPEKSK